MLPEFLWQMPGEDDLGMEIARQYVSYYIGKKKENYFSSQSAFC